ncbi:MAG: hypothetical protein CO137_02800 [Candidatus Magasanikbacteria bacterium CG_4_9_14_3_um_filter_32_9]|uniref:Uncharacterized protein n=1 Tax=Candidatus Magasanikbacteria bacterium CG_4_9_14_3_um_filter_32_9 TaxID=1974644 RepID=A0A2M7Z6E6_9BACT|nr:MAG: hypothetical protein CO137_02800 [Candidatus Magasanikbacteria bacterium CG_4_9_14_3_um_filter_32_9]
MFRIRSFNKHAPQIRDAQTGETMPNHPMNFITPFGFAVSCLKDEDVIEIVDIRSKNTVLIKDTEDGFEITVNTPPKQIKDYVS